MTNKRSFIQTLVVVFFGIVSTINVGSSDSDVRFGSSNECLVNESAFLDIQKKQEDLTKKQKELEERSKELDQRENMLQDEFTKLKEFREKIVVSKEQRKKKSDESVAKVIETLEKMSPKASAKVIESMDEELAVLAVSKLDTSKLAKVMNLLTPAKAALLSERLAFEEAPKTNIAKSGQKENDTKNISTNN